MTKDDTAIDGDATDTEVVAQAKNGDRHTFEYLILRHQTWIFSIDVPNQAFPAVVAELGRSAARSGHIARREKTTPRNLLRSHPPRSV